jgi:signal transduction histidine kinase
MTTVDRHTFLDDQMGAVLARAGVEDDAAARAVLAELWSFRESTTPPRMVELPAAEALGFTAAEAGHPVGEVVRVAIALGRALAQSAVATGAAELEGAAHLRAFTAEAAARAAEGHARFGYERREAWLSYLSHQIKNPLNTVLNAIWLLREHTPRQPVAQKPSAERFLELAEKAVRKIEAELQELRQLHKKVVEAPPVRESRISAPPKQ